MISTSAPLPVTPLCDLKKTYHPCTIHQPRRKPGESDTAFNQCKADDFHLLVEQCQRHVHKRTCYKYDSKECRFGLHELNVLMETVFDSATGTIDYQKLDGLINNFNKVILAALRCNTDISFIGTGFDAKAILFYITDYITKMQLPTHVAYATLELALKKLEDVDMGDSDVAGRAKLLLRKCANSLLAKQELSAQQVSSFLLGYDAKYTGHSFSNLYWPSFESYIRRLEHVENDTINDDEADVEQPPAIVDDETVSLTLDDNGKLVSRSAQIADYIYRPHQLDGFCLWDYIAQVQKKKKLFSVRHV